MSKWKIFNFDNEKTREINKWVKTFGSISCACLVSNWVYKEWSYYNEQINKEKEIYISSQRLLTEDEYNDFPYEKILHILDILNLEDLQYWLSKLFISHNIEEITKSDMMVTMEYMTQPYKTENDKKISTKWILLFIEKLEKKGWIFCKENEKSKHLSHYRQYEDTENKFELRLPWLLQMCVDKSENDLLFNFESKQQYERFFYKDCPFWYREFPKNKGKKSLLIFTGILGSGMQHNEITEALGPDIENNYSSALYIIFPSCFISSKIMYQNNREHPPDLDHYDFTKYVSEIVEQKQMRNVDIFAWSYGGIISTIFERHFGRNNNIHIDRRILAEPSGSILSCLVAYITCLSPSIKDNIENHYHLSDNNIQGYIRLILFCTAFKIRSVTRCLKYHLMFRNLEWGECWNNNNTYLFLGDKDEIVPLHHGGLKLLQNLYPKAHLFIHKGNHGQWNKIEDCLSKIKKLINEN